MGQGWNEKVFPIMRGETGIGQDKTMRGADEDPILRLHPILLSSLHSLHDTEIHPTKTLIDFLVYVRIESQMYFLKLKDFTNCAN